MKNERGITLVEVLAAVMILSLVIMLFTNLSNYNRSTDQSSDRINVANQLLEKMTNELRVALKDPTNQPAVNATTLFNTMTATYTTNNPTYEFFIDYKLPSATLSFTNPCSGKRSTSMVSNQFFNSSNYLLSITACWSP